jgi:hypothetical protein
MRFDQAVARAAALATHLTDPRFAVIPSTPDVIPGVAVQAEGFWSFFPVTEGLPIVGFVADVKEVAGEFRKLKTKSCEVQYVGNTPMQLKVGSSLVNMAPLVDPTVYWPYANRPFDFQTSTLTVKNLKDIIGVSERAAVKDQLRPGLGCVRFFSGLVEAGDEAQFVRCRSGLAPEVEGLVPARSFQKMKVIQSSQPSAGFRPEWFLIQSHGEYRLIRTVETWYPPLGAFFESTPEPWRELVVPTKAFQEAMKAFKQKAQRRFLRLWTEGAFLNVSSLTAPDIEAHLEVTHPSSTPLDFLVHGERLSTSTKTWTSSTITLRWQPAQAHSPLRLLDEDMHEFIFPLLEAS